MSENILVKLFEHNHWANLQILQACAGLSDEQLDAQPQSATMGSIRTTLVHLVSAQYSYLRLLTLPVDERRTLITIAFADLQESASHSGEALIALAGDVAGKIPRTRLETRDGHLVEPWVVMLQVINHATEHREQIKSMLSALGVEPPSIDGWDYGENAGALTPPSA
jgi:uncharacterized damage-inducible protein DinB